MTARARANGEGSIFPYRNGYAAYVWVTKPDGKRAPQVGLRQDPRGRPRQVDQAAQPGAKADRCRPECRRSASTSTYWLREVVEPNLRR